MTEPYSHEELVDAFRAVGDESQRFWGAFAADEFAAPLGTAWSPADNVRHLIKSTRPVAAALQLPRPALAARFGRPERPSRSYGRLRQDYLAALAAGGDAGSYAPSPAEPPADVAAWQEQQIAAMRQALGDLEAAMGLWEDGELDGYQLPHPLLGNLTIREMLCFTHYHQHHHMNNVTRLRGAARGAG